MMRALRSLRTGIYAIRNNLLWIIGWRKTERMENHIPGDEERGAITLTTIEYRPWWERSRIVDEKVVDWMEEPPNEK